MILVNSFIKFKKFDKTFYGPLSQFERVRNRDADLRIKQVVHILAILPGRPRTHFFHFFEYRINYEKL